MSKALFDYFERELRFFQELAKLFSKEYPGPAGRLLLDKDGFSTDPHVERLIQAFSLIAGRIHHKLDDEFPELTDALLSVLYPHYLAPVPSMAILQFELDPARAQLPNGFLIDRHSRMHTQPIDELRCEFRTGYPVTLWPLELTDARLQTPPFQPALPVGLQPPAETEAALRLQLACQTDLPLTGLALQQLRFYLSGENALVAELYELLFNHTIQVGFRCLDKDTRARPFLVEPDQCLFPVGFEREEGLLPYPNQSFLGYRLLTEFFAFPNKFLFFDLGSSSLRLKDRNCWERVRNEKYQRKLEVIFFLKRRLDSPEQEVGKQTFRLGCTPVINLFKQTAEPIHLTQTRHEYPVVPDVHHPLGMEVYSVDAVTNVDPTRTKEKVIEYQPFYSFRHGSSRENTRMFWYPTRRASKEENDRGTDIYLNLVDLDFDPRLPAEPVLVVKTHCTNRDLPVRLQQAAEGPHFELKEAAPLARINCLRPPSAPLRPPLRRGGHWRLTSHLNLNHLSLTDPVEGRQVLQEILTLYKFSDAGAGQQLEEMTQHLIDGITAVSSRRVVGRTGAETAGGFCRGVEVTIKFDKQKYVGSGLFLFACVLERFLGLYASINSFSQLVAKTEQGEHVKTWPPRAGEHRLL